MEVFAGEGTSASLLKSLQVPWHILFRTTDKCLDAQVLGQCGFETPGLPWGWLQHAGLGIQCSSLKQHRPALDCRNVALDQGTERAFTGKTVNGYSHDTKARGVWVSAIGGLPLFDSTAKFESGTGGLRLPLRSS